MCGDNGDVCWSLLHSSQARGWAAKPVCNIVLIVMSSTYSKFTSTLFIHLLLHSKEPVSEPL